MKKITLLIILFFNPGLASQQQVSSNFMETPLTICFIDEYTGFAGGADDKWVGELRKTTDGGKNWYPIYINSSSVFANIWFFNLNNILLNGGNKLYRTINGGINWIIINVPVQVSLTDFFFTNEYTGYLCGDGFFKPAFLKSIDGGYNWQNLSLDTNLDLGDVDFINENTGYVVGNRIILKTTNGGDIITKKIFNYYYLFSVDALDSNIAFSAGYITNSGKCIIIKTEDSGKNWVVNYDKSLSNLNKIVFVNLNQGFAVGGNGVVLRTTNCGISWEETILVDTAEFQDVFFLNENTGWVGGTLYPGGLLYKTTNAGENWILQNSLTERPVEFSLLQNYPNPFNPATKIRFKLNNLSKVVLKVYDMNGKEINVLTEGEFDTGVYEVTFDARLHGQGSNLASGVYFYKIDVTTLNTVVINRFSESKKMILIK